MNKQIEIQDISGIYHSNKLELDFDLLVKSKTLQYILDDGYAIDADDENDLFQLKKEMLAMRFEDFKDCLSYLNNSTLPPVKQINERWGTSARLLGLIEAYYSRPISHGALLLALDFIGIVLGRIDGRKDAYMRISSRSKMAA